ncbi:MAG: hypothetical protein EOL91_12675 [Actinobacteria bacterium]|nr:hypothetical protein [Actinomycetota bacterium]
MELRADGGSMRVRRAVVLAVATTSLLAGCSLSVGEPGETSPSSTEVASSPSLEPPVMPSVTESGASTTVAVFVFLGNSILNRDGDCSLTFPVPRRVATPAGPVEVTEAAVEELLAGPTQAEVADGYTSWFSLETTAGGLISVRLDGDTAYVNLVDHAGRINNASTSCGAAGYVAQLEDTVRTASGATRVLFAFDGDPEAFWYWLQIACTPANDFCDPAPFAGP